MIKVPYEEPQLEDLGRFHWTSVSPSAKCGVYHLLHKGGGRKGMHHRHSEHTRLAYSRSQKSKVVIINTAVMSLGQSGIQSCHCTNVGQKAPQGKYHSFKNH